MKLKPDSFGYPDVYLGAKMEKVQLDNDVDDWSLSPSTYVQKAIRDCNKYIKTSYNWRYGMVKFAPKPFPLSYDPDVDITPELPPDITPELPPDEASYYQSISGTSRKQFKTSKAS